MSECCVPVAVAAAASENAIAVAVAGLNFKYAGEDASVLRDVSFELGLGRSLLVLGPSGSGKSTLTICLDGLIPHMVEGEMTGRVCVAGLLTAEHPVYVLATEVGLVFQDPESQFCALTVEDEVAFGLENLRVDPASIEARVDDALWDVGLAGFRGRALSHLSGGEKQRVALAAVLAMGPRILVLDEPSANLDPATASDLFRRLREVARRKELTLVIIEHRLDELAEWADAVLVLSPEGRVASWGAPVDIMYEDGALEAHGVWEPAVVPLARRLKEAGWPVPGRPLGVPEARRALEQTPGLVGRLRSAAVRATGRPAALAGRAKGPTLLSVRNLTFRYPGSEPAIRPALEGVSMDVPSGGFFALVGANGAGKSTLASLVSGVLAPPKGTVFLDGRDLSDMRQDDVTSSIGYVFQNPEHQFVADRVYDELAFSLIQRRGRGKLAAEQAREVEFWLERFGLLAYAERNPFALSQGEKRRLSVAAMLIRGQRVIVLDEPSFGQDQAQTARLLSTLRSLCAQGRTVVIVTHDMSLVAAHAQDVVVLAEGRVLYSGSPRSLFSEQEVLREARLELPALGRLAFEIGAPGLLTLDDYLGAAGAATGGPVTAGPIAADMPGARLTGGPLSGAIESAS
jgi:energy-coupling factor transport system ATP-binding protein